MCINIEFIKKHNEFVSKITNRIRSRTMKTANMIYHAVDFFIDKILLNFIVNYCDFVMLFYKVARYTTIPLNKIWIRSWLNYIHNKNNGELLDEEGVHYIQAHPGGGKTSLMFAKAKDYQRRFGKSSYVTSFFEKPKYDISGKFVYHKYFDFQDFFQNGEQIKQFNTKNFNSLILDEFHLLNNSRKNREKAYNEQFIPLINSLVLMRHVGIKFVLVASQLPKNDIQLMSLVKYIHQVQIVKGFDFRKWLITGKFSIGVKGWKIRSFNVKITASGGIDLIPVKRWYKKMIPGTLDDFDTVAMRGRFSNLPMDKF